MRKIFSVARHEFIGTVTRLGYVLTLVGMPLFIATIGGLSGLATSRVVVQQLGKERRIAVVDDAGLTTTAPGRADPGLRRRKPQPISRSSEVELPVSTQVVRTPSLAAAQQALARGEVDGILRIPGDFLTSGRLEEYRRARKGMSMAPQLESPARLLRGWLVAGLLQNRVDPSLAKRIAQPPDVDEFVVDAEGKASPENILRELGPMIVPLGFTLFLILSIFTSASYLATGLAEDKQNRALEMLLTSVTTEQLFWGKLLGLWAAAFLQFALYLGAVAIPAALVFGALGIHAGQMFAALAYFVLGFFFFGAVLLAVGAIGNSHKYTQQLSGLFTFMAIVPLMTLPAFLGEPSGALARTLTYIPFTAPIAGMLRSGASALPAWELALSLAVLAASAWLVIRGCAKIFRVALLATGGTPGLSQIVAWLRQ